MARGNCFNAFDEISSNSSYRKKDYAMQSLYEYEAHYLNLIKNHSKEIAFIESMLKDFRDEQEEFYKKALPEIAQKLAEDNAIDPEMRRACLDRLTKNMDRSFSLSENLIKEFLTKKLEEFHNELSKKIESL